MRVTSNLMIRAKELIPLTIRNRLRWLLPRRKPSAPSPIDVVKANTREAFEYFYNQDEFIAKQYLEPERIALYEIVADRCLEVIRVSGDARTLRICDVGCGTGEMLQALASSLPAGCRAELFGVDFASSAISKAKLLLPAATLTVADLYENNLPIEYFDLVLCLETLEHLQTPERALSTLVRVCKPDGHIIITVPNGDKDSWEGHVNFWNVPQFAAFLSPAGHADIDLVQDETTILTVLSKRENAGHELEATNSSSN